MSNPIEDELVRRTRWLLAQYGEAIVSDVSTGRRAKIHDLVIIEELANKSQDGKPAFAVFDFSPDDDTDVLSTRISLRVCKFIRRDTRRG